MLNWNKRLKTQASFELSNTNKRLRIKEKFYNKMDTYGKFTIKRNFKKNFI